MATSEKPEQVSDNLEVPMEDKFKSSSFSVSLDLSALEEARLSIDYYKDLETDIDPI